MAYFQICLFPLSRVQYCKWGLVPDKVTRDQDAAIIRAYPCRFVDSQAASVDENQRDSQAEDDRGKNTPEARIHATSPCGSGDWRKRPTFGVVASASEEVATGIQGDQAQEAWISGWDGMAR